MAASKLYAVMLKYIVISRTAWEENEIGILFLYQQMYTKIILIYIVLHTFGHFFLIV